jgi:hypothetical protein
MPDIFVDEVNRIFTVEDVRYPTVSDILQGEGFGINPFFTEQGADNGTRRHLACYLDDIDDLIEGSIDEDDLPYLEAWRQLKKDTGLVIIESEKRKFNLTYKYCGKPDTIVMFDGHKEIWDRKTGKKELWHRFQIGGYIGLYDDVFYGRCVYLQDNGLFKLGEKYGRKDREDFLTILKTYYLREEMNHAGTSKSYRNTAE